MHTRVIVQPFLSLSVCLSDKKEALLGNTVGDSARKKRASKETEKKVTNRDRQRYIEREKELLQ